MHRAAFAKSRICVISYSGILAKEVSIFYVVKYAPSFVTEFCRINSPVGGLGWFRGRS
jgi:hypothetical protein